MMTAVLEVLDTVIVSIALPNMKSSLGANTNQITWTLTAYIVASAISIPLTGFLQARLGRKRLLIACTTGFMISSALCGLATNLEMMVFFRILQGLSGAVLIPLSQSTIQTVMPRDQLAKGMAAWGIGIMAAPILGPTIGAYITATWNWRFIFYLNIPICIASIIMAYKFVPDTPRIKTKVDWTGLGLLALAAASFQFFLDQGNEHNWFHSHEIVSMALISVTALGTFIVRGLLIDHNIVDLHIFKDRNFVLSFFMMMIFSACLFSTLSLQPIMLQQLYHYPIAAIGLALAPRGIAAGIAMGITPTLMRYVDSKILLAIGATCGGVGIYMLSLFNLHSPLDALTIPLMLQGFGMGLFFVPLSTVAFLDIAPEKNAEATGFFNYGRMLGTSMGISVLSTIVAREAQVNWHRLGAHIQPFNPNLHRWLQANHLLLHHPITYEILGAHLIRQSTLIAFIDGFYVLAIAMGVLIPLTLWMRRIDRKKLMEAF